MSNPGLPLALFLVLSIALGACGSASPEADPSVLGKASTPQEVGLQSPASDTSSVDDSVLSQASDKRPLAPQFTVGTGNGSTFSLGDHRGEVVVLYFSFPG